MFIFFPLQFIHPFTQFRIKGLFRVLPKKEWLSSLLFGQGFLFSPASISPPPRVPSHPATPPPLKSTLRRSTAAASASATPLSSFDDCVEDPTYAMVEDYLYKNRSEDVMAVCSFEALAHNSSGKPIGIIVGGWMAYRDQMGVHLYALRGAGRLAKALRDGGFHDGPVVYESENKHFFEISKCLDNLCDEDEGELERVLQTSMPWDVEDVDAECKIHIGDPEEVMKVIQSMAA